jgi:hypothetical protein
MFTSSAIILTINLRSERNKLSYQCCVVTRPCCWWSSAALLIFNKSSASERSLILTLHHLQRPAEVFYVLWWHCHRSLIQEKGAQRCAMFRASIFMTRVTNTPWHVKHLLHTEALHSLATTNGDGGMTKVKGCPCLRTAARIFSTARRKLISLLYCPTLCDLDRKTNVVWAAKGKELVDSVVKSLVALVILGVGVGV